MSKMNFDMKVEDPNRGKKFPWLALLVLVIAAGAVAWALEPIIAQTLR